MPTINITMGEVSEEQKKQLIEKLTADAIEITKVPAKYFTVLINELPYENMGVGGITVKDIRAGKG